MKVYCLLILFLVVGVLKRCLSLTGIVCGFCGSGPFPDAMLLDDHIARTHRGRSRVAWWLTLEMLIGAWTELGYSSVKRKFVACSAPAFAGRAHQGHSFADIKSAPTPASASYPIGMVLLCLVVYDIAFLHS